jgi:hypothetical protein
MRCALGLTHTSISGNKVWWWWLWCVCHLFFMWLLCFFFPLWLQLQLRPSRALSHHLSTSIHVEEEEVTRRNSAFDLDPDKRPPETSSENYDASSPYEFLNNSCIDLQIHFISFIQPFSVIIYLNDQPHHLTQVMRNYTLCLKEKQILLRMQDTMPSKVPSSPLSLVPQPFSQAFAIRTGSQEFHGTSATRMILKFNNLSWELEEIDEPLSMLDCHHLLPEPSSNVEFQMWTKTSSESATQWFIFDADKNLLLGGCIAQSSHLLALKLDDGFYYFRPSHPEASQWTLCGVAVGTIREISFALHHGTCSLVSLLSDEYADPSTFSISFKGVVSINNPTVSEVDTAAHLKEVIASQFPNAISNLVSFLPELMQFEFDLQILLVISCRDNRLMLSSSPIEDAQLTIQRSISDQDGWDIPFKFHIFSILSVESRRILSTYFDRKSRILPLPSLTAP